MDQKQVCTAIVRQLDVLRLDDILCDVTLCVGEVGLRAHKVVLSAASNFFRSALGKNIESSSSTFKINGINSSDMLQLLDFIYTGQIVLSRKNIETIKVIAEQLEVPLLTSVCDQFEENAKKGKNSRKRNKQSISQTKLKECDSIYKAMNREDILLNKSTGIKDSVDDPKSSIDESMIERICESKSPEKDQSSDVLETVPPYCETETVVEHDKETTSNAKQIPNSPATVASRDVQRKITLPSETTQCPYNCENDKDNPVDRGNNTQDIPVNIGNSSQTEVLQTESFAAEEICTSEDHPNKLATAAVETIHTIPELDGNVTTVLVDSIKDSGLDLQFSTDQGHFHDYCLLTGTMELIAEVGDVNVIVTEEETYTAVESIERSSPQNGADRADDRDGGYVVATPSKKVHPEADTTGCIKSEKQESSSNVASNGESAMRLQNQMVSPKATWKNTLGATRCPWCCAQYSTPDTLRDHMKLKHVDRMHRCEYCPRLFTKEGQCDNHMDRCRIGGKVNGRYRCPQCEYTASKLQIVAAHYRAKHTNKLFKTCDHCRSAFHGLTAYHEHLLVVHNEDVTQFRRRIHVCNICDFRTIKRDLFRTHQLGHSSEKFTCKYCSKEFKSDPNLQRHIMMIHENSTYLKCTECTFTSRYKETLQNHQYRVHHLVTSRKKTIYHCHYCDYSNVRQSNVHKHEQNRHSDERPHLCSFCPKSFKRKPELTIHERIHTGSKPYLCTLCPYAGRSKAALVTHLRHSHSTEKHYVCELCGFSTKGPSNLWLHKVRCKKRLSNLQPLGESVDVVFN